MSRLVVIGVGPRPGPGKHRVFAPGLRLETIVRELVADGHDVAMAELFFGDVETEGGPPPPGVSRHVYTNGRIESINELVSEHKPDGMIALTDRGGVAAAWSDFDGPVFVDYFGHPMAERQMQAAVHDSNDSLDRQWVNVLPALLRADAFGVCSTAQKYALTGELGAAGRLNAETCGHDFVNVLRPALPFSEPFVSSVPGFLRGREVPEDARIILFTGGYNTWLDEELLFHGVERVLANDPKAVYVTTGGEIKGHVHKVFGSFRKRVEASPHRDRYRFLGWVAHEEFVGCCLEADVGVSTDRWTLEGEFGCRNRLFGWLWAGMRAVASDPSELTADLAAEGLVETAPAGDVSAFAEKVGTELERGRPDEMAAQERRARLQERWAPRVCYEPLLEWARDPQRAPDRKQTPVPDNPLAEWQHRFAESDSSLTEMMSEATDRLLGSRAFALYNKLHPETRNLLLRIREELRFRHDRQ